MLLPEGPAPAPTLEDAEFETGPDGTLLPGAAAPVPVLGTSTELDPEVDDAVPPDELPLGAPVPDPEGLLGAPMLVDAEFDTGPDGALPDGAAVPVPLLLPDPTVPRLELDAGPDETLPAGDPEPITVVPIPEELEPGAEDVPPITPTPDVPG